MDIKAHTPPPKNQKPKTKTKRNKSKKKQQKTKGGKKKKRTKNKKQKTGKNKFKKRKKPTPTSKQFICQIKITMKMKKNYLNENKKSVHQKQRPEGNLYRHLDTLGKKKAL